MMAGVGRGSPDQGRYRAACSDQPSKADIRKAVDATLGQRSCFNLADMSKPVSWPRKLVEGGLFGGQATLPPFIANMEKAGYVRVEHTMEQQGRLLLQNFAVITLTVQAAGWWDSQQGWCVGKRAVAEIQEWTLPGKDSGQPMRVRFTWKLVDVPAWAQRREFEGIPGIAEPVESEALLTRTSNGWIAG